MAESNPNATKPTTAPSSSAAASHSTAPEKPICAICYGDLLTLSELVQSIPVCGHVFHELCLQHWIDYCSAEKEPTCPVCKQCCAQHPPTRLYFQSTANSGSDDTEEPATNPNSDTANLPQGAVIRMEMRISALDARVQEVDYKVNRLFRESANREVTLLCELTRQEKLHMDKVAELAKKTSECSNLKEKNSSLSKELSTLNSETRKLKSRCNILTRSEARNQRKLDDALKLNVQLMEKIKELQRERDGNTRKTLGKRKADAISSKLYASLKNENGAKKCKAEAVSYDANRNVTVAKTRAAKKKLALDEQAGCTDADEKVSEKNNEYSNTAGTQKCVRRARGLRSLGQTQKAEVEVALPKTENRARGRRSKVAKN
ncbi:hypothetical protein LUZ61_019732 [Rhynchospora tenuis]|uniref:RING-type domain-containing protein n=1 Tax=Rhynchospora tenuis TaxID=198213 RepID=A0AAD5ZBR1_9POAL|nr:hypothetical protein LUZ61_019732 [Rhynchospora tenuis]